METNDLQIRRETLLKQMILLPQQMVKIHGTYNTHDFLLHKLCQKDCFNLSKAAYFLDNPDFDVCKGIAGFHQDQSYKNSNHWDEADAFEKHMNICSFNRSVKDISLPSLKRNNKNIPDMVKDISDDLHIEQPLYLSWPVKHGNSGILLFESNDLLGHQHIQEHLEAGVHFLSLCPLF